MSVMSFKTIDQAIISGTKYAAAIIRWLCLVFDQNFEMFSNNVCKF